jgi:hypothetical protein
LRGYGTQAGDITPKNRHWGMEMLGAPGSRAPVRANLEYNYLKHRYVLTLEGASIICDITRIINNRIELSLILNSISNNVYTFIYEHSHPSNQEYIEYKLANDISLKTIVLDAMLSYLDTIVKSRQLSNVSNVKLSSETIEILKASNGKFDLLSDEPYGIKLPSDKYERWNY